MPDTPTPAPVVFVSYSHDSPDHRAWVGSLAADLRKNGIDVILDQWDVTLGSDLTLFMEKGIRTSSRVLLICTPAYGRKANEGQGGVGWERLIVTAELAKDLDSDKFVCLLRSGDDESVPVFLKSRLYIDFTADDLYEDKLSELIADLHREPTVSKPPLGPNPYSNPQPSATAASQPTLVDLTTIDLKSQEDLIDKAREILRTKDLIGWRELIRQTKRQFGPTLNQWRVSASKNPNIKEQWKPLLQQCLSAASPYFILSLAAVDSGWDRVENQTSLLDDLLTPPDWDRSGLRPVVNIPQLLATAYHHIIGAYWIAVSEPTRSIDLLNEPIQISAHQDAPKPIWETYELMGWTHALSHDCEVVWEFLHTLPDSQPWIMKFFTTQGEYETSLRIYQFMASLCELANYIRAGGTRAGLVRSINQRQPATLNVPPMYLLERESRIGAVQIITAVTKEPENITYIADKFNIQKSRLIEEWPYFFDTQAFWISSIGLPFFRAHANVVPSLDRTQPPIDLDLQRREY